MRPVLRDQGLYIKGNNGGSHRYIEISADGNCLFRAMSFFMEKGNQENHMYYRKVVADYIRGHKEEYQCIFEDTV